jgi:SAM-dependent methyltransferase
MSEFIKDQVRSQFAATAAGYVSSPVHAAGPDLRRLVELARLSGAERVLDIATGGGHTALACVPYAREVVASDLTPRMLETAAAFFASQGASIRTELADAEALPFADASFERVTCRIAPHHFPNPAGFVGEAARVLRSGPAGYGRLLLSDLVGHEDPALDAFVNQVERLRDPSHIRSYKVSEWVGWCAAAGLQVVHLEIIRRTHAIQPWIERSKLPEADRPRLLEAFRSAPAAVRAHYAVEFEGDQPVGFCTDVLVLAAEKAA